MIFRQLRSLLRTNRRGARSSTREMRGWRRRLFEQLETRCVLSGTGFIDLNTSTLFVTGDGGANKVTVQYSSSEGVTVTCDGSVFKGGMVKHVEINMLGGRDTFEVTLGDVNVDPTNPHIPLDLNLHGGSGADAFLIGLLNVAIEGDLDVTAEGGDGNDTFDLKMENVQLSGQTGPETSPHVRLHGGGGLDQFFAYVNGLSNVAAPSGPAAFHIDVTGAGGNDDVMANVQNNFSDLHLDVNLGAGQDTFTAAILPDSGVNQTRGDFLALGCIEANVHGGAGADTMRVNVGQENAPEPGKPQPLLASELMLSLDGGSGADQISVGITNVALGAEAQIGVDSGSGADAYLIGLLNVAISGPMTLTANGGDGNDSFLTTFADVNGDGVWKTDFDGGDGNDLFMTTFADVNGDGVWKTDFDGGQGNDTLISSVSNVAVDFLFAANLGLGNDSALVFIHDNDLLPSLGINIAGGDGKDSLSLNFLGQLSGPTSVILDGGDGNDAIDAVFNLAFTNDYPLKAHVLGGKGNDNLALHVKVFDADDQNLLDLLLDASEGRDKYRASDNVKIQKV